MADRTITTRLNLDTGSAESDLRDVADAARDTSEALDQISDEKVSVTADTSSLDEARQAGEDLFRSLEKLADERLRIQAEFDDGNAKADLTQLESLMREVQGQIVRVQTEVDTGTADARLQELIAEMRQVDGDKVRAIIELVGAEDATAKLHNLEDAGRRSTGNFSQAGNAVANLAGPLGAVSGAASDAAGVFDGLSDIVEQVGAQSGASAATISKLTGVLTGVGAAVAAGSVVWGLFRKQQEQAKKAFDETVKSMEKLATADFAGFAKDTTQQYESLFVAMGKVGVGADTVSLALAGNAQAMATLDAAVTRMGPLATTMWEGIKGRTADARAEVKETTRAVDEAVGALKGAQDVNPMWRNMVDTFRELTTITPFEKLAAGIDRLRAGTSWWEDMRAGIFGLAEEAQRLEDIEEAAGNAADAIGDLADSLSEAEGSFFDALGGTDAYLDKLRELPEALKKAREEGKDQADVARHVATVGDGADTVSLALAEQQAASRGAVLSAAEAQRTLNNSLVISAQQATGPARQAIVDYIAEINDIPPETVAEIITVADQAGVETAAAQLDAATQPRQAEINAIAQTLQAQGALDGLTAEERQALILATLAQQDQARAQLDAIAAAREAAMNAVAVTGVATSDLNAVAAPRTAPITAVSSANAAEATLNNTARPRPAPITAVSSTNAAESSLNNTARHRPAPITAQSSTAAAESSLNSTARGRSSTVTASANTGAAESALNNVARPRTATVTVVTNIIRRVQDVFFPGVTGASAAAPAAVSATGLRAVPSAARAAAPAARTGPATVNYNVTVTTPVGGSTPERIGGEIVRSIQAYERANGRAWRRTG